MDPLDEVFGSFDNGEQDISLLADNHLFNNGPDLFGRELDETLGESMLSPRPAHMIDPFADGISQDPPALDGELFNRSFDLFEDIDFGNDQSNFTPIPDSSAAHTTAQQSDNAGLGLTFDQTLPEVPLMPTLTIAPAELLDNTIPYPHNVPASNATPHILPMWPSMVTGIGQHQQWPVSAHHQAQNFQPQPHATQLQYMQAIQQLQLAGNQLALSRQSPFQSSVNGHVQSSPNLASLQNPQQAPDPTQSPNILFHQNPLPLQNVEPIQYAQPVVQDSPHLTPNVATSSKAANPPIIEPAAAPVMSEQEVPSEDTPRPRNARTKRTPRPIRTANPVQDEPSPQTPYAGLTFTSLHEAEAAMPSRYLENDWRAPSPDNTVPNSHQDRAYWVIMMLSALQDTSECKDNKNGFSFIKRWKQSGYYNVQEMEKVCWHMLEIAERLHAHGPSATNIYCQDALKKLKASRGLTFEQRIVAICDMLKLSKFLCDNLMKGEGIEALVGAPKQKMSGAKTMMTQNKKRQKWLESGRQGDPLHHDADEDENTPEPDEQDVIVDTRNVPGSTPPKSKQKSKRSASASKPRAKANARSRAATDEKSDDEDEDPGLPRRQSVFGNNVANEPDDNMMDASDRIVSPTPFHTQRTPSAPSRNFRDASPPSPTTTSPLISAPALSPGLLASPEPTRTPTLPNRKPFAPARARHGGSIAERARAGKHQKASEALDGMQREEKPATVSRAVAVVINNGKAQSRKRMIGFGKPESDEEQPAPPAKRSRKASLGSDSSSDDEQHADEGQESDQQLIEAESDEDGSNSEDDEDEDEDKNNEDEQEPEESEPAIPSPSPIRKRKRDTISEDERITSKPSSRTWKADTPSSGSSQESQSEDEPAPRAKRIKNGNDEPARKSATPASAAKSAPTTKGKPQRDANGRFVRRDAAPIPAPAPAPAAPTVRLDRAAPNRHVRRTKSNLATAFRGPRKW